MCCANCLWREPRWGASRRIRTGSSAGARRLQVLRVSGIECWGASRRADESQRPSDALILFACWFTGMVFCLVSILPLVALKSGAPWLLPVILAGTGGLVAIAIRDKRRRRG